MIIDTLAIDKSGRPCAYKMLLVCSETEDWCKLYPSRGFAGLVVVVRVFAGRIPEVTVGDKPSKLSDSDEAELVKMIQAYLPPIYQHLWPGV